MSISIFIFAAIILFTLGIAFYAGRQSNKQSVGDYLVGGRSFSVMILFFLAVGEIYGIGTIIGFPGGVYAGGFSYGIWFLAYIVLSYSFGYFISPLIWRAGHRYNALTAADIFKSHFSSRKLELVVAVVLLMFLVPWAQLQFEGLIVTLNALGYDIPPYIAVIIAGAIAYIYISVSGVRSPALISIFKDIILFAAIVVVGIAVYKKMGGVEPLFLGAKEKGAILKFQNGSEINFAISTIILQSITFYCLPHLITVIFTSKSEKTIQKAQRYMPLYMLMFPFLIATSYYAMIYLPNLADKPNHTFIVSAIDLLPSWVIGFIAAGAALSGFLLLSVISLAVAGLIVRNIIPNVPEKSQRRYSQTSVLIYLVISMIMTVALPSLMLNLISTAYGGFSQIVPGIFAVIFFKRATAKGIMAGIVVGIIAIFVMYFGKISIYAINPGIIAVMLNIVTLIIVSALTQKDVVDRTPIAYVEAENS